MSRRRALIAAIAGAAIALAIPAAAGADVPVSQVGWWTRSPSPPSVPEGGIAVGAAPDGALTVGAVLLDTADGATGAQLRLVETGGSNPLAAVQVCPTTATWAPAAGDAMEDAPEGACDVASVPMERGDDGTWVADVQSLVEGATGEVGLLVAPAADAVAFQLSFAPPTVSGSVTEDAGATSQPTTATTQRSAAESRPASSPSSPAFVAPATPTATVAATPTTLAALPDGAASSSAGSSDVVEFTPQIGAVPAGATGGTDVGIGTVVLWYVVALLVGAAVAGLAWLRYEDLLSPAAVLARVRRDGAR